MSRGSVAWPGFTPRGLNRQSSTMARHRGRVPPGNDTPSSASCVPFSVISQCSSRLPSAFGWTRTTRSPGNQRGLPVPGASCGLAAENMSTNQDVRLVLNSLPVSMASRRRRRSLPARHRPEWPKTATPDQDRDTTGLTTAARTGGGGIIRSRRPVSWPEPKPSRGRPSRHRKPATTGP